jgi:transposase
LTDSEIIATLQAQNQAQVQQITVLEEKVMSLLQLLQKQGVNRAAVRKDSHNSSLPPSTDLVPRTKSLREPTIRKSGGQPGHPGSTLTMSSTPNTITPLKSEFCSRCGQALATATFVLKARRQVLELPPIQPLYEEFRQYSCQCPTCQHQQVAAFPPGVTAPIQYGSSVAALISYLSVYQYVPFKRLQNLFRAVFCLPLSQGTIGNLLEHSAQQCQGVYEAIKEQLAQSEVVGADETGAKVKGKKWWIWTWQNALNTFIVASDNRGSKTIDEVWPDGLPTATLVSDRWAAHLKMAAKHQLCLAHLLREVIFLSESEAHLFATDFKAFLLSVFTLCKTLGIEQQACVLDSPRSVVLENELNRLLSLVVDKATHPQTATFQASILKYRNYLLPCLYHLDIPPDNNGSERAIRTIKVKQKVSGQFRSGQDTFCVIRSVIDTLLKRQVEVLPCLNQILKLQPV